MSEPSNHKANETYRVLKGERLKYTVRFFKPDGSITEFQSDEYPMVKFFEEDRCLWLFKGGYESRPITKWIEGSILLAEDNK